MTSFVKMHALGNDFMVIDAREQPLSLTAQQVRNLADRHTGVGFDQLILIEQGPRLRFWNSDGNEVGACGNGSRAAAVLLGGSTTLETTGGTLSAIAAGSHAEIDMGKARFGWDDVPLAYPMDTSSLPLAWDQLAHPVALSVGNPHAVFEVEDVDSIPLETLGPRIEQDPVFPEGVNVGIVQRLAPDHLRLRVWERGAGLTRACGTGAVAAVAALSRRHRLAETVIVSLPGGDLQIRTDSAGHLHLAGPALIAFRGNIDLEQHA
jgi:diaminopimelate epimerase